MQTPADIVSSDEYQLDRRATALKKAGDLDGAIAALRQRKALLGLRWEDDKLAMYLQKAGRFDEAMAEIQWLLDHSQARARELFGHQPVSLQQASHARFSGGMHRAAALICKREGRGDLAATHAAVADRYMAIAQRLEPIGRAEHAAVADRYMPIVQLLEPIGRAEIEARNQEREAARRAAMEFEPPSFGLSKGAFRPGFGWVARELVFPEQRREALFNAVYFSLYQGIDQRIKALTAAWPDGAQWPSGYAWLQEEDRRRMEEEGEWKQGDPLPEVDKRALFRLLLMRFSHVAQRLYRNSQIDDLYADDTLRARHPYIMVNRHISDPAPCGRSRGMLLPADEGLGLMEVLTCEHPACCCTFDPDSGAKRQ